MARAKKTKTRRNIIIVAVAAFVAVFVFLAYHLYTTPIPVLQPAGPIAAGQRKMMIAAFLLMLLIVVPVLTLAFSFAWRYREHNKRARYAPDWDHNRAFETIWWFVPSALIAVLAVMAWHGSYAYDPYKPLTSTAKPLTIQAIALDWRWLFVYPEQHMASLNYVQLPANTPVKFEITADAPMNSFWIPQLGGQVYAMPGMGTVLNLMADREGTFYGSSANISGAGFADMHFTAEAVSSQDFRRWTAGAAHQPALTISAYHRLAQPSHDTTSQTFSNPVPGLYDIIISKYMGTNNNETTGNEATE